MFFFLLFEKSPYSCVTWYKKYAQWRAQLSIKNEHDGKSKLKCIGYFDSDLEAAQVMNYKCAELGLPFKNPGAGILPPKSVTI